MAPSTKRVDAFQLATAPTSVSKVRNLLATSNYSTRFINNFASITAPLRNLTKSDAGPFNWLPEHQQAFQDLKDALTTNKLSYFDTSWDIVGLGAILLQPYQRKRNGKIFVFFKFYFI